MCNKGIFFSISYMLVHDIFFFFFDIYINMHDIFDCTQKKFSKKKKKEKEKAKRNKMLLHDCKRVF